ncbi:MAG: SMP-30/gluconolactonase/LRE family protein [Cyclobacteriaceae bacterium]|nr:SMP-30/gluconolactonase/LRE family protein [Cyclobacteriaceae bacterium]
MNKTSWIWLLILMACQARQTSGDKNPAEGQETFRPYIERQSIALNELIDSAASVEIIASGFDWTEGPLWVEGLGLLFSDIPSNTVFIWSAKEGARRYLKPSGYTDSLPRGGEIGANGLLLDRSGNLILCQHGDRRIARMNAPIAAPQPVFTTLADNYQGLKLNSPNDACISQSGLIYFTDPPYGLEYKMDDPLKQLDFQGVFVVDGSGESRLLTRELSRPNGIALSPDEKILYVANSDPHHAIWMAYPILEDGKLGEGKTFFDATAQTKSERGLPDGLKVDARGNIFASGPGGIWIFDDQSNLLGRIMTGQATSNCAFGQGGKSLFITADMHVMQVALK